MCSNLIFNIMQENDSLNDNYFTIISNLYGMLKKHTSIYGITIKT